MDRNLALEFVRVTEAAAIASARWIGRGDKHAADQAAVDEMRSRFNQIDFKGTVVIGEGEKDKAPMLYTGEVVGNGSDIEMDLAIDPLEATDSVAHGRYNALTVIAAGPKNSLFHAPDMYMDKLAVGPEAANVIDLHAPVKDNIVKVAHALGKTVEEVTVVVLERERHASLIKEILEAGARVRTITDGDVAAAVATCLPDSPIDMLMGWGGSTEAVLAAVPIKIMGGQFLGKLIPKNDTQLKQVHAMGISDINKVYTAEDLAQGDHLSFTATGVIEGPLLDGVIFEGNKIITHSMVIRSSSGTLRYITTHHHVKNG